MIFLLRHLRDCGVTVITQRHHTKMVGTMIRRWYEYDPMKDKIKVSAGIVLILNGSKILLVHPSKAKWFGTYSVPKGGVNVGESDIDAALRELREETSLVVSKNMISNPNDPIV